MIPLRQLPVLLIDCQATGPNPQTGRLLEIGWMPVRAADVEGKKTEAFSPRSFLVRQPQSNQIPERVSRITGITAFDLEQAQEAAVVIRELFLSAQSLLGENHLSRCPTVIHFSRYETRFLTDLCERFSYEFHVFDVLCTHEISRRLLPGLPRKGLRALAGYFGHSVHQSRRTDTHLIATAHIWFNLVYRLEQNQNIHNLHDLKEWLRDFPVPRVTRREFPLDARIRLDLPDSPGIYRMVRSGGEILYVGKATSIRKRVNSYFHHRKGMADHILEMLSQAKNLDITPTQTPLEAALLESDEIKIYDPPYNKQLKKNGRRLVYCSLDLDHFQEVPDKIHCLGPFPGNELIRILTFIFADNRNCHAVQSDRARMLGLPESMAPEASQLSEGLELFRSCRSEIFQSPMLWKNLRRLGEKLWLERLAESNAQKQEETKGEKTAFNWTPERLVRFFDHLVMRVTHLERRARWLCLLSESVVHWKLSFLENSQSRLLQFSGGKVKHSLFLEKNHSPDEFAPECSKNRIQRQRIMNLSTYDRLSVLTSEIKKMRTQGRPVEIFLSNNKCLGNQRLDGILRWI